MSSIKNNKITNDDGSTVNVQHPLPTDGDSVYKKDINVEESNNYSFSGSITDYFDDLTSIQTDNSLDNPKKIKVLFKRTVYATAIGIGCNDNLKNFSNIKLELLGSSDAVRLTVDLSSDDTKLNSKLIVFNPSAFNGFILSFLTSDEVCLSNITIRKEIATVSRIQALKEDGEPVDVGATNYENLRVSVQEYGDTPSIDAFARLRTSEPFTLFDSKQLHDKQPLFWDEELGGSATSVHSPIDACVNMTVTANVADYVIRQTKQRFNYQPGKALSHGEPVLTTDGYINIEEIKISDHVFDGKGDITEVIGVYPQGERECYRITFDDDTHVDCDGEHLWKTIIRQNKNKGKERILTVNEMLSEYGEEPPSFARWKIPESPILKIKEKKVEIDPYTLGVIIGDGHIDHKGFTSITNPDLEIIENLKCDEVSKRNKEISYGLKGLSRKVKGYGLNGKRSDTKFIPKDYKFNCENVRLSLLKGLMDTDGSVDKGDGCCEYNTASEMLANDIAFLCRSLGGQAKIRVRSASYKNHLNEKIVCKDSFRVRIIMPICPFKLHRKACYWKPRTRISFNRYIHSIKPIGKKNATCIRVASEDHTFLTRNNIVTHNSQLYYMTFSTLVTPGVTKRIGCFDGTGVNFLTPNNGIFFEMDGVASFNICKNGTTTESVTQQNWNLDKLDGTGRSKLTLSLNGATQIMIIDFEWLGVGRVRVGFIIGGVIIYCHEFNHANDNNFTSVYMSTPNLPLRYSIETDGSNGATLSHICSSVISEGGLEKTGILRSHETITPLSSLSTGVTYAVVGIRLKDLYKDITIIPEGIGLLSLSNDTFRWAVGINPIINGTFTYTDIPLSAAQGAVGTVLNSVSDRGIVIDSNYVSQVSRATQNTLQTALRIGSKIDGTQDTLVLMVTPITNNITLDGVLNYRELL